jgi:peptidoglycan/LPS O-acetylase OafA/YrhL
MQYPLKQDVLLSPSWTLCYEIQFYFVMAFFISRKRWWWLVHVMAILGVAWRGMGFQGVFALRGFFLDYWAEFYSGIIVFKLLSNAENGSISYKNNNFIILVVLTITALIIDDIEILTCGIFSLFLIVVYV